MSDLVGNLINRISHDAAEIKASYKEEKENIDFDRERVEIEVTSNV